MYIPKVGESFPVFADGRISPSRVFFDTITEVLDYETDRDKLAEKSLYDDTSWYQNNLLEFIEDVLSDDSSFFSKQQTKILFGGKFDNEQAVYLLTSDDTWFGIGSFCAGLLDTDLSGFKAVLSDYGKTWLALDFYKPDEKIIENILARIKNFN